VSFILTAAGAFCATWVFVLTCFAGIISITLWELQKTGAKRAEVSIMKHQGANKKKANRQRCDQRPGAQNYRGLRQDGTPKPGGSKLKWPSGLHPRQRWHNAIHGVHLTEHQTYYTETTAAVVCHLSFLKIGEDYAKMKAGPCKIEKTHLEDPRKKHGKWGGTSQK
jgi:hypothetical protein